MRRFARRRAGLRLRDLRAGSPDDPGRARRVPPGVPPGRQAALPRRPQPRRQRRRGRPSRRPAAGRPTDAASSPARAAQPVPGMPEPSANCLSQRGRTHLTSEPWAQRALDFSSVWDLTRGQHITVAVVDSGIDYTPAACGQGEPRQPDRRERRGLHSARLDRRRASSRPATRGRKGSRSTAWRPRRTFSRSGFSSRRARAARPTRSAGRRSRTSPTASVTRSSSTAKVINVSIQVSASYPALRSAVEFALHRNVVVVANGRQRQPGQRQGPFSRRATPACFRSTR